jgi:hypothetical protein
MRRPKFGKFFLVAALASALAIPVLAIPAGAFPSNACGTVGATANLNLTQFPVVPGGSSLLALACTEKTQTAIANTKLIYEDYPAAIWHWGAGRNITVATTAPATNTLTTAACPAQPTTGPVNTCGHFTSADVNHGISGPMIPPRAFIKTVNGATSVTLNISGLTPLPVTFTFTQASWTQPAAGGFLVLANGPIPKWSCYLAHDEQPCTISLTAGGVFRGEYALVSSGAGTTTLKNLNSGSGAAPGTVITGPTTAAPAFNKSIAIVENSDGRSFTDVHTSATAVCSATANFRADDLNRYISGGGNDGSYSLANFTKISPAPTGVTGINGCNPGEYSALTVPAPGVHAVTATMDVSAAGYPCNPLPALTTTTVCGTAPNGSTVQTINGVTPANPQATYTTTTRYIKDATYFPNTVSPTPGYLTDDQVCSATAKFGPSDINLPIFNIASPGIPGAGRIPVNNWITAVTTGAPGAATDTCARLNNALVGVNSNRNVVIGQPNAGAPAPGDTVVSAGVELSLNPTLVAGQPACTTNTLAGFNIDGVWNNPGYTGIGAGVFSDAALDKPVLGQFAFPTAVLTFNAYLMQVPATAVATATRHQLLPHYEVIYPLVPTGAAVCPGTETPTVTGNNVGEASVFHFSGFSPSQGGTPSGVGTPGTVALRGLQDRNLAIGAAPPAAGIAAARAYYSTTGATPNPAWSTNQHCYMPIPPQFGFYCGQG